MATQPHLIIVGGGAAGFFAALTAKSANNELQVTILEATSQVLRKVAISGGGRCNVTHACFEPKELVKFYPRGNRELLGAFHKFQPRDTVEWFESRGVKLKTEADGRMFPVSDSSQSIIDCLTREAEKLGVSVLLNANLKAVEKQQDGRFALELANGEFMTTDRLLLACGGTRSLKGAQLAESLGHSSLAPVPSLFSFRIKDERLKKLSGVAKQQAAVSSGDLKQQGALLITHEGLSGPAILKLSAWGARIFAEQNYDFTISVDWTAGARVREQFTTSRQNFGKRQLRNDPQFEIPQRLWERLLENAEIPEGRRWLELRKSEEETLVRTLTASCFQVSGKSLNKDEFVTCGGIPTREVDFRSMESKLCPGLYFAGEILDIDGVTGGFNFQNAWTTAYLAGTAMANC
ncbi:MAG: NAD(P)/FAD-dependent oxidoreductase [Verrucomicrobiales bacterium]|jgi:predicted Rossmann fold flavoprotein|nr:NAD(P)/FAD-dependent oxidoreductase [Verrucomicrobiales bacterium]